MKKLLFLVPMFVLIGGCAGSKVSTMPTASNPTHPVNAIALAPEGGLLAEAVGIELLNYGYTIIDASTMSRMLVRWDMSEIEVSTPQGLSRLSEEGIDAYLTVKAAGAYDDQPQSASARASSTHTGRVIAGISWQNGWGGQAGSIADRTMRKGLAEAAQEIAAALAKAIPLK